MYAYNPTSAAARPARLILNGVDDDDEEFLEDYEDAYQFASDVRSSYPPPNPPPTVAPTGPYNLRNSSASGSQRDAVVQLSEVTSSVPIAGKNASVDTPQSSQPIATHTEGVTVPIRTSSSNAVTSGDRTPGSIQGKQTPKRNKSMASVPEERSDHSTVDNDWMTPTRRSARRATLPSPLPVPSLPPGTPARPGSTATTPANTSGAPWNSGTDLIDGLHSGWTREKENILRGPFDYLESHPGKDIRTQMITAFNAWLQVPAASLAIITGVVTMLHTASLLIDDVEDNSQLRRGVPVANSIFGTAQTINSANYIYFCALQEVLRLNNPEAINIYTEELLNLHRGQGMDLFWRDTLTCPSEDDYLEMVGNKTGGLFRLAIKLMCAESPRQDFASVAATYVPLVNTVGLLFQILDDYRNLSDTVYTANKGHCEDLTEGKFSFPVIHAIRAAPSNLVLINILKQKTTDDEVKRYAVAYMERCGSFSYTRRVLRGLTKKALQLVDEVDAGRGKSEAITSILERLRVDRASKDDPAA